ncbi:unnamed protein product [Ambrosiozyma monospora]|uniref:Unnamed protein product n=1 Tax=Ambrosiozyma monospora TaxID=43982 RepID=A0ACB5U5H3_AMBMO|nr:unnamed protein product [Ambrosiozyma monospora]
MKPVMSPEDPLYEGFGINHQSSETCTSSAQKQKPSCNGLYITANETSPLLKNILTPLTVHAADKESNNDENEEYPSPVDEPQSYIPMFRSSFGEPFAPSQHEQPVMSINRPISAERRRSSMIDIHDFTKRIDSLRSMRPFKLIGTAGSLVNWNNFTKLTDELKLIENKPERQYYEYQNDIAQRYIEVDNLLDTGIHISMIENYEENSMIQDYEENHYPIEAEGIRKMTVGAPADIDIEGGKAMGYSQDDNSALVRTAIYVNFLVNLVLLIADQPFFQLEEEDWNHLVS